MKTKFTFLSSFLALMCFGLFESSAQPIELRHIGTYHSGIFDEGAAEIVAYEASTKMLFVVNSNDVTLDIINISDPTNPTLNKQLDMSSYGGSANSVAILNGIVAVAVENNNKQGNGVVVFLDSAGNYINDVTVGALPDMVTFTPDGKYVLCANEGEPSDDYLNDPEGTVSIIEISSGVANASVATASFTSFNSNPPSDPSIRIYGNNGAQSFAQDVEPEYIAVSADSKTAFVSLQENNALAKINIENATVDAIYGLGFKDHLLIGNALDASDKDDSINIRNWPVYGMPQPDAIATYEIGSTTYIVTANEGDARDYSAYAEEERVKDLKLDSTVFPNYRDLQMNDSLGRLTLTSALGDIDNDGEYEELYCLGTRSFSIYDENGQLIFDSGDDFEQITAMEFPDFFNANNDENDSFESRSDNKGPEPEGVTLATIQNSTFAFIGLERVGGIMVYDITDPNNPDFIQYINNRDFTQADTSEAAGDMGPEGIIFIPKDISPNGKDLIATGNEVSGTTSIFEIDVLVGISEPSVNSNSLIAYPNPSKGGYVSFNRKVSGNLYDVSGRTVRKLNNRLVLNVEDLQGGLYVFKSDKGEQLRLIIE